MTTAIQGAPSLVGVPATKQLADHLPRDPQPRRIVCVYENQPLSRHTMFAVSRLVAQLLEWFAQRDPTAEVIAVSPGGGSLQGVRCMDVRPSAVRRACGRVAASSSKSRLLGNRLLDTWTLQYQRAHTALRSLSRLPEKPTVVLATTYIAATYARRYLPQAQVVYWPHSLPRLGQEAYAFAGVNAADLVVAPSAALYQDLFQLICRNRFTAPVRIIPNGIDLNQFPILPAEQRSETRRRLNIAPTDWAIVHVGRTPEKGLQVMEMALRLGRAIENKKIVLVSVGGNRTERRALAAHADVIEIGRVPPDQLNAIYQACDLSVVPSVWWENCPLALLEMMTVGLCPVASRVGGIPEIIDHGQTGFLIDQPNNPEAWWTMIAKLLADRQLVQRCAASARQRAHEQFHWDRFAADWGRVLDDVLDV